MSLQQALNELSVGAVSDRADRPFATLVKRSSVEAETVTGEAFQLHDVPGTGTTEFTHFLDGAQRAFDGLFWRFSPIPIVHTSAAVVERVGTDIQAPREDTYLGGFQLLIPNHPQLSVTRIREVLEPRLRGLNPGFIEITTVNPPDFGDYEEAVDKEISRLRDSLERELALGFHGGRLLIDGGLKNALRDGYAASFVVGVVKSHSKRYFASPEREELILKMRQGQRTSLFLRPTDYLQGPEVYSFYLRLHEPKGADPFHGVIRVELPPDPAMAREVDQVAGWILAEKAPLSLPDFRFDKLLYPIRMVEQHLKARQPSTAAIMGLLG